VAEQHRGDGERERDPEQAPVEQSVVPGVAGVLSVAVLSVAGVLSVPVLSVPGVRVVVSLVRDDRRRRRVHVTCVDAPVLPPVALVVWRGRGVRTVVLVGRHASTIPLGGITVDSRT
jgi:hypothetical protein